MNREQRYRLQQMTYEIMQDLPKAEIEEVEIPKETIDKLNAFRVAYKRIQTEMGQICAEYDKLASETYQSSFPHLDGNTPFATKVKRYVKASMERCSRIKAEVEKARKDFNDDLIFSNAPNWRKLMADFTDKINAIKAS